MATNIPAPPPVTGELQWRSLIGLKTALTWLLALDAVVAGVTIVAVLNRIGVIDDAKRYGITFGILERAANADDFARACGLVLLLLTLAIIVCFIVWMFRAAKNNEALGRSHPRFSSGWAIGGWFIPLANLVIPVLIMQDLWRGSDPSVPRGDMRWRESPRSGVVALWWTALVLSLVRVWVSDSSVNDDAPTLSEIRSSNVRAFIGLAFTIPAAVLAILVVRKITDRQEECLRAQRTTWEQASGATPPAPA